MRLWDIVRENKEEVSWGSWRRGKMPKNLFPLNKNRSFRVRGKYRWRLCRFKCRGLSMRLLIYYRDDIQEYQAILGIDLGDDNTRVLARYEYHSTHPGWHMHAYCDDIESFSIENDGRTGYPDQRRLSGGNAKEGNKVFSMYDRRATEIASVKFGLSPKISDFGLDSEY